MVLYFIFIHISWTQLLCVQTKVKFLHIIYPCNEMKFVVLYSIFIHIYCTQLLCVQTKVKFFHIIYPCNEMKFVVLYSIFIHIYCTQLLCVQTKVQFLHIIYPCNEMKFVVLYSIFIHISCTQLLCVRTKVNLFHINNLMMRITSFKPYICILYLQFGQTTVVTSRNLGAPYTEHGQWVRSDQKAQAGTKFTPASLLVRQRRSDGDEATRCTWCWWRGTTSASAESQNGGSGMAETNKSSGVLNDVSVILHARLQLTNNSQDDHQPAVLASQ
jgi:uncharacterized protein YlbG (UPF0298 family)